MAPSTVKPLRSIGFVSPPAAWLWGHGGWRLHRLLPAGALLAAALLLAAVASAWWDQRSQAALQALAAMQAPRAVTPPAASSTAAALPAAAERASINRIVRRLNTPWDAIFEALEQQASPRVAVLAIESDAERGAVRVNTEGPALDELLAHAQRVQGSPRFVRTQLLRIEPTETGLGLSRLSFDLMLAR